MPTQRQRFGQGGARPPWVRFLSLQSVQLTAAFWVLATIAVFLIVGDGELPFGVMYPCSTKKRPRSSS